MVCLVSACIFCAPTLLRIGWGIEGPLKTMLNSIRYCHILGRFLMTVSVGLPNEHHDVYVGGWYVSVD